MKIVQINAVHAVRSTGRQVTELSRYLEKFGHDNIIIYSSGKKIKNGYKIGSTIDSKIHALLSRFFGLQAYYSKHATRKMIKYLKSYKPDLVHLNNLHANFINLKIILQYLSEYDIPTVITLHDCWFYTGKCTHYTQDECSRWQIKCGNCPRLKKDNKSWFFDRTTKMLLDKHNWFSKIPRLGVVGVSKWITNEVSNSILKNSNIITTIYNWIDLNLFKHIDNNEIRDRYLIHRKFVILGVASEWTSNKGLEKFIELSNHLKEDETIILLGNIKSKADFVSKIINIPETNEILDLVKIYSMSDVFINLSKEESFGKTTAEALSCGLPVITNSFTANPELINAKCGLILENLNVETVLKAIKLVKQNGKSYYSLNSRMQAEKNFLYEDRAQDYLDLYKRLIDGGE